MVFVCCPLPAYLSSFLFSCSPPILSFIYLLDILEEARMPARRPIPRTSLAPAVRFCNGSRLPCVIIGGPSCPSSMHISTYTFRLKSTLYPPLHS
ncbi:hypothetical protein BJX70DRAFT_151861 [Aspergillus crustosus]